MSSELHDQVLADIDAFWRLIASQPEDDELMEPPPEDLTVFQHDSADLDRGHCTGTGVPLDTLTRQLERLPPRFPAPPEGNFTEDAFHRHAWVRFHVDEAAGTAVLEFRFGPLFGRGTRYVRNPNGRLTRQATWVS